VTETLANMHGICWTFSVHQSHICDTVWIGHLHVPYCTTQMQMSQL